MSEGAPAGAPVVLLDEAAVPLGLAAEERGRMLNWIAEGSGSAGSRVGPLPFQGGIRAETPFSPVHLGARRLANGDLLLSWIRRGRVEADDWDAADIPLDEPEERYRLDILEGSSLRRSAEVAAPQLLYSLDEQITDFGQPLSAVTIRVRQLGRAVPLGVAATATIQT